jgi:hypothetical protein
VAARAGRRGARRCGSARGPMNRSC